MRQRKSKKKKKKRKRSEIERLECGSAKYQLSKDQPRNWQEQEKDKQKVGERNAATVARLHTVLSHCREFTPHVTSSLILF